MNLSDNVQVETARHPIGTKYRSHRHRLTLKLLCEGAQTIAQAPNRSNPSPDATQGMAHLGFRCGPRGESGTPRRQSNRRNQRNSSHRFGTSPRGAETPRPAAAAGIGLARRAVARRGWIRSRRGAVRSGPSAGAAVAPEAGTGTGRRRRAIRTAARLPVAAGNAGGRLRGEEGQRGFWLALGGNGKQGGDRG